MLLLSILAAISSEFSIERELIKQQGNFFVEMGANNGINSHSRALEAKGWHGICIEGSPTNFALLQSNRPYCKNINAVAWSTYANLTFRQFPSTSHLHGHSGIYEARSEREWNRLLKEHHTSYTDLKVRAVPLETLVPSHVDVFILDVEGAEMNVLRSFPWSSVRVNFWIIESNKLNRRVLVQYMRKHSFDCSHFDNINTLCSYVGK